MRIESLKWVVGAVVIPIGVTLTTVSMAEASRQSQKEVDLGVAVASLQTLGKQMGELRADFNRESAEQFNHMAQLRKDQREIDRKLAVVVAESARSIEQLEKLTEDVATLREKTAVVAAKIESTKL